MTFTVTKQWIHDNTTTGGSWTAKQLAILGVKWHPPKGWINRANGMEIRIIDQQKFEQLAGGPVRERIDVADLERRVVELERQIDSMRAFLV